MEKTKLTVGVVGAGAISDIYLQNMTQRFENLTVKSICANHFENAAKKAAVYGLKPCTMEEMLEDPEIDMIVNLTPVGAHYGIVKNALLHGKHVYTEKTLTDDVEKSGELLALAEEKGLYLGSAPDTFLGAALQTARRAIDEGLIGKVHSFVLSANRNNDILVSIFSFLRQPGAGVLNDYAVYYVTGLVSILGPAARVGGIISAPYKQRINVFPQSPEFGQMIESPNESEVSAIIQLENGITGTLHLDCESVMADQAYFAIYGEKGILYMTDPNAFGGQIMLLPNTMDFQNPPQRVPLWNYSCYDENSRGIGPSDLADAVLNHRPCRPSKEMAYHVQEILAGILSCGEQGGFVDIHSTFRKPAPMDPKPVGITNIGHTSYQAKDMEKMLHFYCDILGMKKLFVLTLGDLCQTLEEHHAMGEEALQQLRARADQPWIAYLKLADRQYIELFYDMQPGKEMLSDRKDCYGFMKQNYETEDIRALRDRFVAAGYPLDEDLHPTLDGSTEFVVHDPDGNEIQFTEYPKDGTGLLILADDPDREVCSMVSHTTQAAYQIKDTANMLAFYTKGLGLKHAGYLTFGQLFDAMKAQGIEVPPMADRSAHWIDYIETAPHQYIELFSTGGKKLREERDLSAYYGYQHLCLEVSDIQAAWEAVKANGLKPDGAISLGPDGAYQFWLTDPDGNRIELMQYTDEAKQLK